ncbi:hypothetical protein [Rugosimonospora africana]|nr:hypothetical protein [Rugosimonospora africana]
MTRTETSPPPSAPAGSTRRSWTRPQVRGFETRPEVTAYAGADGPWNNR